VSGWLLDTHALVWWLNGDPLTDEASAAISQPDNRVMVSAVSIWEMSIKAALGRLTVVDELLAVVEVDFDLLPVSGQHGWEAGRLPMLHRDPFDRMLIAQAQLEDLVVVTRNAAFARYDVPVLAC